MSLYFKIKNKIFPIANGAPGFIPQFRLEGRSRDANDETGLEMRVADPLWMLGRQWQFGEFRGEDNGSPIQVNVNHRREKMTHYTSAHSSSKQELTGVPTEVKVEAMIMYPKDLRSKVRIGQKIEALIKQHFDASTSNNLITKLRLDFPLVPTAIENLDLKSRRFLDLMAGEVINGGELLENIQENKFPYRGFKMLSAKVIPQFKNWYQKLFVPSDDIAWKSDQLAHQFSLHGEADIQLDAPDYQSGHLDWYSFDKAKIGINPTKAAVESKGFMPINVSFSAMPEKRLFSFEDSQLDLSGMDVDKDDLVRLMIIDFSLISGSDWFIVPLEMELGECCWVNKITVKDVFGVSTIIDNKVGQTLSTNPLNVWDAFKIRSDQPANFIAKDHFLYLPDTTSFRQESLPLEELLFLRDEYANMVWAIEKTVCNELGNPTNGYDLHLELNGSFLNPPVEESEVSKDIPKFKLASTVPTNWIPYLPTKLKNSDTDIELQRAVMMRNHNTKEPVDIEPLSLLASRDLLTIREEAIPRSGIRVQLTKQRVRAVNGDTFIWMGRKILAGRGEASSGLAFDRLEKE